MKKIAFITGATAGIGEATARILATEGYKLIITGRRKDRLEKLASELDTETICLSFDVRVKTEVENAINNLPPEWKNIDLLINNAGLAVGVSAIQDGINDDWERMIDTNIKGLLYISKQIIPLMIARKSGQIINISSIAGKEVYPGGNVYCASKHAVDALTKGMRIDLLPHNIKVSAIAPGMVETEFSLVRLKGDQESANKVYDGFDPLLAQDIAEAIVFVASRPAHVNVNDMLIMPTAQASARDVARN